MIYPLPSFPPLFPSGEWWKIRLHALLEGATREESTATANRKSGFKSREWMRFVVVDRNEAEVMLSLPVVHGASALKNTRSESWKIADDRPKLRKLNSTLATLYGHTPFFHLLGEELKFLHSEDVSAAYLCHEMDEKVWKFLGLESRSLLENLRMEDLNKDKFQNILQRMEPFNPRVSVIDSFFRYGPDTIFRLL